MIDLHRYVCIAESSVIRTRSSEGASQLDDPIHDVRSIHESTTPFPARATSDTRFVSKRSRSSPPSRLSSKIVGGLSIRRFFLLDRKVVADYSDYSEPEASRSV
jgi:hypothetical protein